ncbi:MULTISPECIES: hypothetical protein [unclassified Nocardioides]|uniref:hypothetical protein n=1 Tax=unclassified Nocardioides TaxID=2615069 RepID=UPI0009F0C26E|nr:MULTISPECIES: hypothetical protein [unclassified Nocardioides]GAW49226.1 hypothetical protein PD653B2_1546 [Nocardioides sp. PD653-B2]GAW55714.1 hypothetical protein PD653_3139 [Nocardioides sp. PD653]
MRSALRRLGRGTGGEFGLRLQVPLDLRLVTPIGPQAGTLTETQDSVTVGELLSGHLTVLVFAGLDGRRTRRWSIRLEHAAARLNDRGISVVAVHDRRSAGPGRLGATGPRSLTVLTDPSGALAASMGTGGSGLPVVAVLDGRGNVCWRHKGQRDGDLPPVAVVETVATILATMTS